MRGPLHQRVALLFGIRAHLQFADPALQAADALAQLLLLRALFDLAHTAAQAVGVRLHGLGIPTAADDGDILLRGDDPVGLPKIVNCEAQRAHAGGVGDKGGSGEQRNVALHVAAQVLKRFDRGRVSCDRAARVVADQRVDRLLPHVLADDEELIPAGLCDQVEEVRDLVRLVKMEICHHDMRLVQGSNVPETVAQQITRDILAGEARPLTESVVVAEPVAGLDQNVAKRTQHVDHLAQ